MSANPTIERILPETGTEALPDRSAVTTAPARRPRLELIAPLLAGSLILGALAGSGIDVGSGGARLAGGEKRLGDVRVVTGAEGTPVVVAEVGRKSRGRMLIWHELPSGAYSLVLVRRLGELKPGTVRIPVGSGHATDGSSPGTVEATSSMQPFELSEPMADMPAGNYSAELQLRSQ